MDLSVFKAYDIRGIVGKEITNKFCEALGKAFGSFVDTDEVIVGYDTRSSSEKIFENFAKGVTSSGKDVINLGMVPNPVAYFNGLNHKLSGVIVTASHNPPEYNGFKFFRKDGTSYIDELKYLKEIIIKKEFKEENNGQIVDVDFGIGDYAQFLRERINIMSKVKIVAECFHGAASIVTPYIFNLNNIETIAINNNILGDFGGLRPEPKKDNLNELKEKVISENADFGVAFDGDADRAVFVDDRGRVLNGAQAGAIFIKDILKRQSRQIVATIDCPTGIAKIIKENGGKVLWTRIGHGFIEENLVKNSALFGFEQSAHFYFNTFYPFSDGILAALKMAEIISSSDKKLSEMVDEIELNPTEKMYVNVGTHEKKKKLWRV